MSAPVLPYLSEVKSLYGLPTEDQLDDLEWARDFMNNYERRLEKKRKVRCGG